MFSLCILSLSCNYYLNLFLIIFYSGLPFSFAEFEKEKGFNLGSKILAGPSSITHPQPQWCVECMKIGTYYALLDQIALTHRKLPLFSLLDGFFGSLLSFWSSRQKWNCFDFFFSRQKLCWPVLRNFTLKATYSTSIFYIIKMKFKLLLKP